MLGALLLAACAASGAGAQTTGPMGGAPGVGGAPGAGGMAIGGNPYANPYMNPFMNPMMTQTQMSRNDTMLYFMAAQQQPGGLLGPRPKREQAAPPPKEGPANPYMMPGAGASGYFGRGVSSRADLSNYYGRRGRHFATDRRQPERLSNPLQTRRGSADQ